MFFVCRGRASSNPIETHVEIYGIKSACALDTGRGGSGHSTMRYAQWKSIRECEFERVAPHVFPTCVRA